MKHFTERMSRDEIRHLYHSLARAHHPDIGGDTATMQEINAEYAEAMDAATRREMPGRTEASYAFQGQSNDKLRQAIERAAVLARQFPHLTFEVCGWWIWVSGSVKGDTAIPTLKEAGYRWAREKQRWYLPTIPASNKGERWDMERIRKHYGSANVEADTAEYAGIPAGA